MTRRLWFPACVLALLTAAPAWGQAVGRRGAPRFELGVSAVASGPMPFGASTAELDRPEGGTLRLFTTTNSLGPERGLSAHIAARLAGRVSIEGLAGWSRANLRTRVTDDFENAAPVSIAEPLSRLSVEAAGLIGFRQRPGGSLFLRGGGGWVRELAGSSVLVRNGAVANLGAGMKYWWRHRAGAGVSHIGFRLEGHAAMRWNGISLGSRTVHVAPMISGGLLVGM